MRFIDWCQAQKRVVYSQTYEAPIIINTIVIIILLSILLLSLLSLLIFAIIIIIVDIIVIIITKKDAHFAKKQKFAKLSQVVGMLEDCKLWRAKA